MCEVEEDRNGAFGHSLRGECGLKLNSFAPRRINAESLSARRVWIEIESIDGDIWEAKCHSLRGECGLKFWYACFSIAFTLVTLCEESVD